MSLRVEIEMGGLSAEDLQTIVDSLEDRTELHAQIAGDAERFMQDVGPAIAAGNHTTANRLGASPTGHLADAYEGIESIYDAASAALLIPQASRLRAAFGSYTVEADDGGYLTIPVNAASYGRRAREFSDLKPIRVGPKKTLILARVEGPQLETMYLLVESVDIPEDPTLIPFQELANEAGRSAGEYIDSKIESALNL